MVGVLIGAPLGVVLGRSAWIESIDKLGIVDDPTVPWRFAVLVLVAAPVGAGLVGSTRRLGFWLTILVSIFLTPIGGFVVRAGIDDRGPHVVGTLGAAGRQRGEHQQ